MPKSTQGESIACESPVNQQGSEREARTPLTLFERMSLLAQSARAPEEPRAPPIAEQVGGWAFGDLKPLTYDLILADPATKFETWSKKGEGKSPQAHYDTMTWEELAALQPAELARGDALLFLWACWPTIKQSLDLMEAWGFRYVTGGAWHKRAKNGNSAFGPGYRLRTASEPYLIGTLGNPASATNVRNIIETEDLDVIDAVRREHSRKPDVQYDYCRRMAPRAVRFVELFARQAWPGWDAWGNQVGKFEARA